MTGGLAVRLGLLVASVALVLVSFELAARIALPGWAPAHADRGFWHPHPLLGWAHEPYQTGMHRHRDFDVEVTINSQGLRDLEYPQARSPGRPRMLVLGDSFGWGHGVEHDEIWAERLEARHPHWEIINASVAGYGTDQQLLYLMRDGSDWQPDVVLHLMHPNDVADTAKPSRYGYRKPQFVLDGDGLALTNVPVQHKPWHARLRRALDQQTYVVRRLALLPELLESTAIAAARRSQARSEKAPPDLTVTRRLLDAMAEESHRQGARLVVIGVPMDDELWAAVSQALDERGVASHSLNGAFAGHRSAARFPHDPHWNAFGNQLAADEIERFLIDEDVFAAR